MFQAILCLIERETGNKLKCSWIDNGSEYTGPFDVYCKEHCIRHQMTPPKAQQLNGLAKRMNTALMERIRCLLSHSKLPKPFWGKGFLVVVHILNRSPCVPLKYEALKKVWLGNSISYKYL